MMPADPTTASLAHLNFCLLGVKKDSGHTDTCLYIYIYICVCVYGLGFGVEGLGFVGNR